MNFVYCLCPCNKPDSIKSMAAIFKTAAPYADDAMNLPVKSVDAALPFYQTVMGFQVLSRADTPRKSVVLGRDSIQIGLAENGGDPAQEGCFFEVDDVEAAFSELQSNGLDPEWTNTERHPFGSFLSLPQMDCVIVSVSVSRRAGHNGSCHPLSIYCGASPKSGTSRVSPLRSADLCAIAPMTV
jgi:hypothetical protein